MIRFYSVLKRNKATVKQVNLEITSSEGSTSLEKDKSADFLSCMQPRFVCACMHVCVQMCMNANVHVYNMYTYMCVHEYVYMHVSVYICVHVCVCMFVYVHVHEFVCVHVCGGVYVCICLCVGVYS